MGNSRKYPYPTTDGFHVLTPPLPSEIPKCATPPFPQNSIVRVVTRYMGSGINSKKWGGIRNHSAGIWDHKPWDRDQHYCKGIMDQVFRHNNKDHKILKCALIGGTCRHFSIQLYFCCNISIQY